MREQGLRQSARWVDPVAAQERAASEQGTSTVIPYLHGSDPWRTTTPLSLLALILHPAQRAVSAHSAEGNVIVSKAGALDPDA